MVSDGVVAYGYIIPSIWDGGGGSRVETGESVQLLCLLHSELETSLGYVRLSLRTLHIKMGVCDSACF